MQHGSFDTTTTAYYGNQEGSIRVLGVCFKNRTIYNSAILVEGFVVERAP